MNCIWMRKFEIQAQILLPFLFKNLAAMNYWFVFFSMFQIWNYFLSFAEDIQFPKLFLEMY